MNGSQRRPRPQGWSQRPPTRIPGKNSTERVDLDVSKFDKLLAEKGIRVRIFRTMFCPNTKSIDGAEHNIDCPFCQNGWLDVRPIEAKAFIQNQSFEKMIFSEGMVDGNTVAATFERGVDLQYFTLIELIDFPEIFFQRVKRQQGNLDVLKYRAHQINVCIDQRGKEYFHDADFTLDQNGSIRWLSGRGPDPGDIYSVHYMASMQFRAIKAMHVNRFTQVFVPENGGEIEYVKLHEQWQITKEFLVKRRDRDGNEILPNLIGPKTDPDEPNDPFQN